MVDILIERKRVVEKYANNHGSSDIVRYQIGGDYIIVEFKPNMDTDPMFYRYTYTSAGQSSVEEMKRLARLGSGLGAYIDEHTISYGAKGPTLESL